MTKRVFLTGGSRGIGVAIKKRYLEAGCEVISPTRQELDLSKIGSIQNFIAYHSNIEADILINNAAENFIYKINELELPAWQNILTVNLTAPFLLIKSVLRFMAEKRWGRIVNISSVYSQVSRPGRAAYSASKSGLVGLTRTTALEYADQGILVNSVCPGFIDTELTRKNNSPEVIEALVQQIPMKRLGTVDEVADLVYFLGSDHNSYITGQVMIIDGGYLAQ